MPAAAESFGMLLRRHRLASGLTQERLAEIARVSAAGVASLEVGRSRFPRLTTVLLLADALSLEGADRSALIAAASPQPADGTGADLGSDRRESPATGTSGPPLDGPRAGLHDAVARFGQPGRWRHPFVGRAEPLSRLQAAWAERSRIVLVAGEAGIGKTRLVDEFARDVARSGASVLWGRWTMENLGPFAGFVVPVTDARHHLGDDPASTPASLLPLLGAPAPSGPSGPVQTDSGVRRRLLFETVAALFGRLGRTLLVLDDVQWADPESHSLLGYLATRPDLDGLAVVATLRTGHLNRAAAAALAGLDRTTSLRRVDLAGLSPADVAELVDHVAGAESSVELVSRVAQACDGNAFFAEELAEHLMVTGLPAGTQDSAMLPGASATC